MKTIDYEVEKINLLKTVCLLGVAQYDDEDFVEVGKMIITNLENKTLFLIKYKTKKVLGSFLANWYNNNKARLTELQNKIYYANFDSTKLIADQNDLFELNIFLDLLKQYNPTFYEHFFIGTDKVEYRKNIKKALDKQY